MSAIGSRSIGEIAVGDEIASITFHASLTALIKYAAATWDFHPYHYDAESVSSFGLPAPLADGQMFGALIARMLMSWGGPDAFVRSLKYRVLAPVFAGETINLTGKVTSKSLRGGMLMVGTSVSVATTDGKLVVRDAAASVELPQKN